MGGKEREREGERGRKGGGERDVDVLDVEHVFNLSLHTLKHDSIV